VADHGMTRRSGALLLFMGCAQSFGAFVSLIAVVAIDGFTSTIQSLDRSGDFLSLTWIGLVTVNALPLVASVLVAVGHVAPLLVIGRSSDFSPFEAIATQAMSTILQILIALFLWASVLTDLLAQTHRAGC
jgi:hypothetical protein